MNQQARPSIPAPNTVAADQPPTAPRAVAAGAGNPVSLTLVGPTAAPSVGGTFQVSVMVQNGRNIFSVPLQLQYDPRVLELVNVDTGDFLARDGKPVALVHRDDPSSGTVTINASRPPAANGITGDGGLCTLTFKASVAGDATLSLIKVGAKDAAQNNVPTVGNATVIHVK